MQITQELTQLCAALSQATGTTIPTTQHLHFTPGKIFASNLETSITANYPHDLDFAVDAKTFVEAIKATPDGVISIKDNRVIIKTKSGKFQLAAYPTNDKPTPEAPEGEPITMTSTAFELAKAAAKYCSKDELRPVLTGVYFGNNQVVSTDAHRLIVLDEPHPLQDIIIPATAINFLNLWPSASSKVRISDKAIQVDTFEASVHVRLVSGKYPPYQSIIPTAVPALSITITDIPALINQVKRVMLFSADVTTGITLDFSTGTIQAENIDFGKSCTENYVFAAQKSDLNITLNGKFFLQMLQNIENSSVELQFFDAKKPVLAKFTTGLQLLMPISKL